MSDSSTDVQTLQTTENVNRCTHNNKYQQKQISSQVDDSSNSTEMKDSQEEAIQQTLLHRLDSDCCSYDKNDNRAQESQISTENSDQTVSRSVSSKSNVKNAETQQQQQPQQFRWLSWSSQADYSVDKSGQSQQQQQQSSLWVSNNPELRESGRQSACSVSYLSSSPSSCSSSILDMESLVSFRSGIESDSEYSKQQLLTNTNLLISSMRNGESHLHRIKEEAESDTTSMCSSSMNVAQKGLFESITNKTNKITVIARRKSSFNSDCAMLSSQDARNSLPTSLSRTGQVFKKFEKLRMLLGEDTNNPNELTTFTMQIHEVSMGEEKQWNECERDYSLQKRRVFRASSKLLQAATLAQKYPIFSAGQSTEILNNNSNNNNNNNNPSSSSFHIPSKLVFALEGSFRDSLQIDGLLKQQQQSKQSPQPAEQSPRIHRRTTLANMTLGALTFWPNFYISSQDNALFHLYWKPQKSLHDVLHSLSSDGLICQQILLKKIPGIIDRWKKKTVSLFIDRIEYHKAGSSKSNRITSNAISLRHFQIKIIKDNFRRCFTLHLENSGAAQYKKKYTFKCSSMEENTFWVETIIDVMLVNEAYCKFQLFPQYTKLYEKQRVCSVEEVCQMLKTGDLFYFREDDSKIQQIGFVVKTFYLLQVCYFQVDEGVLVSYPLDTFLSLDNLQILRFRSLQDSFGEDLSRSDQNQITQLSIKFIKENQERKFTSSYHLVAEIMTHCHIVKQNTPYRALYEDNLTLGKFNQYLEGYSYSNSLMLILHRHVNAIYAAPFEIHSLLQDTSSVTSEIVSFCSKASPNLSPLTLPESSQVISRQSLSH